MHPGPECTASTVTSAACKYSIQRARIRARKRPRKQETRRETKTCSRWATAEANRLSPRTSLHIRSLNSGALIWLLSQIKEDRYIHARIHTKTCIYIDRYYTQHTRIHIYVCQSVFDTGFYVSELYRRTKTQTKIKTAKYIIQNVGRSNLRWVLPICCTAWSALCLCIIVYVCEAGIEK